MNSDTAQEMSSDSRQLHANRTLHRGRVWRSATRELAGIAAVIGRRRLAAYLALLAFLVIGAHASAQSSDDTDAQPSRELTPPDQLVFGRIQNVGEGCPDARSIEATITVENVLLLNFKTFRAEVKPGKTHHRVLCSLLIGVKIPKNRSFGISNLGYGMSVSLADGVTGKFNATYQMAGRGAAATKFQPIVQAPSDDASFDFAIADENMPYSPCGDGIEEQVLIMSFILDLQKSQQGDGEGFVELKRVAVPGRGLEEAESVSPPVELPAVGIPRIKWRSCGQ